MTLKDSCAKSIAKSKKFYHAFFFGVSKITFHAGHRIFIKGDDHAIILYFEK